MVNHPHAFYLRFFLNRGINVMIWNYRSYGRSHGSPDPFNIRNDAETVLRYMREHLGISGKMGVYGRSLGGIPTTHLGDKVQMIIVDRTFSDFDTLAYRKFYNPISKILFRIGTCSWKASNYRNLIDKGKDTCYKVFMTEKNDEIVDLHSSLMMGVAREFFFRIH